MKTQQEDYLYQASSTVLFDAVNAFDIDAGCFSIYSASSTEVCSLLRIRNSKLNHTTLLEPICINLPNKNILYIKTNNSIIAYQPKIDWILHGIKFALNTFKKQFSEIEKWFNLSQVNNMFVRVIPYSTATLNNWIMSCQQSDFSKALFIEKMVQEIADDKYEHILRYSHQHQSLLAKEEPLPRFAIRYPFNHNYILKEACSLSIPVYYCKINEHFLYNGDNEIIKIPPEIWDISIFNSLKYMNDYFFPSLPLSFVKDSILALISNDNLIKILKENLEEELSKFYKQTRDETPIVPIEYKLQVDTAEKPFSAASTTSYRPNQ